MMLRFVARIDLGHSGQIAWRLRTCSRWHQSLQRYRRSRRDTVATARALIGRRCVPTLIEPLLTSGRRRRRGRAIVRAPRTRQPPPWRRRAIEVPRQRRLPQVAPAVALHAALAAEEPEPSREGDEEDCEEDVEVVVEGVAGIAAGTVAGGGDVDVGGEERRGALRCRGGGRGGGGVVARRWRIERRHRVMGVRGCGCDGRSLECRRVGCWRVGGTCGCGCRCGGGACRAGRGERHCALQSF